MTNFNKRVPENVPGEFFVDSTCMDCNTCRQFAPATFGETSAYAFVHAQPQTTEATRQALLAEQSWRDYAEPTLVYGAA